MDVIRFNLNPLPFTIMVQLIFFAVGLGYLWLAAPRSPARQALIGLTLSWAMVLVFMFFALTLPQWRDLLIPWLDVSSAAAVAFGTYFLYSVPTVDQPVHARRALRWTGGLLLACLAFAVFNTAQWTPPGSTAYVRWELPRLLVVVGLVFNGLFTWRRLVHFSQLSEVAVGTGLHRMGRLIVSPPNQAASIHRDLLIYALFPVCLASLAPLRDAGMLDYSTFIYLQSLLLMFGSVWLAFISLRIFSSRLITRISAAFLLSILTFFSLTGVRQIQLNDQALTEMQAVRTQLQTQIRGSQEIRTDELTIPSSVLYIILWPQSDTATLQPVGATLIHSKDGASIPPPADLAQTWMPPAGSFPASIHVTQRDMPVFTNFDTPNQDLIQLKLEREFFSTGSQWLEIGRYADWPKRVGDEIILALIFPILIISLGAVIVLPIYFRRSFSRPLDLLVDGAKRANAGQLDVNIPVNRMDEIGQLTVSFNTMIASIRQAQAHLEKTNAHLTKSNARLEETVARRTQQLQAALTSAEEARQHAEINAQKAQTANLAKSRFLAIVNHELRTPLNAILGYNELLNQDPSLNSTQRERLAIVDRNGVHLLTLINNVLDLSKMEAGHMKLTRHPTDLRALINDLAMTFHVQIQNKEVTLQTLVDPRLPQAVLLDANKIRQILINILGNAVKFTEHGTITLTVELTDTLTDSLTDSGPEVTSADPIALTIRVRDTGPGIPDPELDRIFDAFSQIDTAGRITPGTGLGLTISRDLATFMGGELTAQSELGVGSVFTLNLVTQASTLPPAEPALAGAGPIWSASGSDGADTALRGRLLVVDDSEANRSLLETHLLRMGFSVQTAANGREAVDVWASWQPDLIFMDLRMPDMDGWEALAAIRAQESARHTIIIALTAGTLNDEPRATLNMGFDAFLAKPFRQREIGEILRQHLGWQFDIPTPNAHPTGGTATSSLAIAPSPAESGHRSLSREESHQTLFHDLRNHLTVLFGCIDNLNYTMLDLESDPQQLDMVLVGDLMALLESRVRAIDDQIDSLAEIANRDLPTDS